MPTDRNILCGGTAGPPPCSEAGCVRLDMFGPLGNARLHIEDIRGPLAKEVPDPLLDLLDVATYVYVADQAVPRGRPDDADLGARWRRRLFFRVPVRVPDLWAAEAVRRELEVTLGFLSDDEYHFEFEPLVGGPMMQRYLDFQGETPLHGAVDEVVMFSGGLDSLGGAIQEAVVDRRRVLLVNHRSTPKGTPRHERLLGMLRDKAGAARPEHVAVWANKDEGLGRSSEQRARSFLFAALGAVFAVQLDLPRFRFYENGVISLNLPISGQLVGARATRTTHPKALAGFERLFGLVCGRPVGIGNPFRWHTKADVARLVAAASCGDLIPHTVSCVHTWGQSARQPHCGRCSQCLDRRLAVLAAGCEAHEPAELYEAELFTGGWERADERHLVTAYFQAANEFERMTPTDLVTRFGQVARALRHLGEDAETVLGRIHALHVRHGWEVCAVLDRATGQHSAALRRGELPAHCALRLVVDPGDPPAPDAPEEPPNYFRRRGEVYEARFRGGPKVILTGRKSAAVVHRLLAAQGNWLPARVLTDETGLAANVRIPSDGAPALDRDAIASARQKLQELQADREQARRDGDTLVEQEADAEIKALADRLRSDTGLGGRLRLLGDLEDAARKAVNGNVAAVVRAVRAVDPVFADHLKASIKGGKRCRYEPAEHIEWSL